MKKVTKGIIIICTLIFCAGFVMVIVGFANHGGNELLKVAGTGYYYDSDMSTETKKIKEFKSIEMDSDYSDVEFVNSKDYRIEYTYIEDREPVISETNGKILIGKSEKDSQEQKLVSLGNISFDNKKPKVTIYYPMEKKLENVTFKGDLGEIALADMKVKNANVEKWGGNLHVENSNIEKLEGYISEYQIENSKVGKFVMSGNYTTLKLSKVIASNMISTLDSESYIKLDGIKAESIDYKGNSINLVNSEITNTMLELDNDDLDIADYKTKNIKIESEYGDVKIANLKAEIGDIDVEDGNVELENSNCDLLKIENEYGNVNLNGACTGTNEINAEDGDVVVNVKGERKNYSFKLNSEDGETLVTEGNEEVGKGGLLEFVNKNSKNSIKINCNYGDVKLHFE